MSREQVTIHGLTRRDFLKVGGSALAAASILGLTGCGGSPSQEGEQVQLEFANWVSAEAATRENMNKVIKAFQDQNEIDIKNTSIPFDQMEQQLLNRAAGGNSPDIMQLSGPWSQQLGANGALIDMREIVGEEFLNKNYKGALEAGEYQDSLYAIPLSLTPHGFWYNKDLMEQAGLDPEAPPATMDELNQQIEQGAAQLPSDVYPIGIDTTKIDYALVQFWPWFFAFGARPLYNDQINFNTPEVGNALEWLRGLANNGYTPTGQQIKELRELSANDRIMFRLDGPYLVGILRSLNSELEGDTFYEKYGVTKIPVGANDESQTLADIHQLGISSQTEDREAAWEFAKYLVQSEESVQQYQIPYGVLPALKPILQGNDAFSDPVSQSYIDDIFPTMVGGPYGPNYGEASNFIIQAMQTAALENTPIEQILKQTQQNLETVYGS